MSRIRIRIASRWVSALVLAGSCFGLAAAARGATAPTIGFATRHGKSARLSEYRVSGPVRPVTSRQVPNRGVPKKTTAVSLSTTDTVTQRQFGLSHPEPVVQFEGASDDDNAAITGGRIVPPDTEGDIGPSHYLQYINSVATIYDKSGQIVLGPFKGNAFWQGLGGPCEIQNDGDPLARYDRQADRWVVSQFALPNFPDGPFYQCFAVSITNDPTGEYWQYEFKTSDDFFTDYGKIGVWPDAYYMSFNMFGPAGEVQGGAYAFDRSAMLAGAPAGMIVFDTGAQVGVLPSDLDGPTPPPAGSPNYFLTFDLNPARLLQWQFHVDWTTPANSTFTGPLEIPVAEFLYPVCNADRGQCIPQLDSPEKLETLGDRLMYRLVYRNFGEHESLVVNHTVGTESGSSALRWYEIRQPGDTPVVYQQGTYAPDDNFRWMGSLAMDRQGNIALGYSKSSAAMYPSIGVTGRLAGDPPGTMGAEDVFLAGGGSQVGSASRWGDYSSMSIDPVDDCTFWYTQEYYGATGDFDFQTRVGAFRFPSCTGGATGILEGSVTSGGSPLGGATVTANPTGAVAGASVTTTDASGHYQFLNLPAGSYDVTASLFGYIPGTATGLVISDGGTTVQDFQLALAPTVLVVGTVRDGSGQGWPLYAKLVVTGPSGFPGATLFTDPVTGYYSLTVPAGVTYDFAIQAVGPGYVPGGGPLDLSSTVAVNAPQGFVANWTLSAAPTCNAPGYEPGSFTGPPALSESFDAGTIPAGWNVNTVSGVSWQVFTGGDPCFSFDGNQTGGSGPYAVLDSNCFSDFGPDNSSLVTAPFDLTGRTSAAIQWASDFVDFRFDADSGAQAKVDVSVDGGATWTNIWEAPEPDQPGPVSPIADLSFAAGKPNVLARFNYQGTWAWWWQVDDVLVGTYACTKVPGGLLVGTVSSANTGDGIDGASVRNAAGGTPTATFPTPDDPTQGDGFYILFSESGAQSFEASYPLHDTQTKGATVVPNSTTRLDFSLAAGLLQASPRPLSLSVVPGAVGELTLTMANTGTADATFGIQELSVPPPAPATSRPITRADAAKRKAALKRIPVARMDDPSRSDLPPPPNAPTNAPAIASAGEVVGSFPTNLASGTGLAYDTELDRIWIANPDLPDFGFLGDGLSHEFQPDGAETGNTIDIHDTGGFWQADGTYDGRTGNLWQVNVGQTNCLFEMDPVTKVVTGATICGPWSASQRGVAYDYATDTYYVGGNNEATIYHLDASGHLLDSAFIGLGIAGLAYNPTSRHLFVLTEFASPWDVWVLDAADAYTVLGGFRVMNGGVPGLPNGANSLEADCAGRLWVLDRTTQTVVAFESGETGWCANEIPWLSESPSTGQVPSGGSTPVDVTFDSTGLLPGLRQGALIFATDTPTPIAPVPVDFTVLFADVPEGSFAWNFIYGAAGAGVMPGCAPQTPTFTFCPAEVVTRRSMAGFIERAMHGALTPPPVYLNGFQDVLAGSFNANYIQGLVDDRITAGCGVAPPLYCPDVPVTRAQMAVFVWKAVHGDEAPPACAGVFDDVPCPSLYADYIEGIAAEGVTVGCGSGDYCPDASITNAQMAVYLVKAFNLAYLP